MRHACRFKLTFQRGFRDPNQADKREIVTRRRKAFDLILMLREKQPWLHLASLRLASPARVPLGKRGGSWLVTGRSIDQAGLQETAAQSRGPQ